MTLELYTAKRYLFPLGHTPFIVSLFWQMVWNLEDLDNERNTLGTIQKTLLGGGDFLIFAGEIWPLTVRGLAESGHPPSEDWQNLGAPPSLRNGRTNMYINFFSS